MTSSGVAPSTDVIIVGAGPAGLLMASLLVRYGVDSVVLEKNSAIWDTPRAIIIDEEYFRLLNTLGLGDKMKEHSAYCIGFHMISPWGFNIMQVEGFHSLSHFPSRSSISQPKLERTLLEDIEKHSNVDVRFCSEVTSFSDNDLSVEVEYIDIERRACKVRGKYLVACDGASSFIRRKLEIELVGSTADKQPHIVVDVEDDPDGSMHSNFHAFPVRPMNSIPLPKHGRRYEFMLFPGEDKEAHLQDDKLQELFSYYGKDYKAMNVYRKSVYTFHARVAEEMRRNRTMLVGDAAHLMPPFGAQGLNSGGRDVNNLAWKLAMVIKGQASEELLSTYFTERVEHVSEIVRMSINIGRLANVSSKPISWVRDSIFWVLNRFEGFRRYVSEQRYLKKPALTKGAIVLGSDNNYAGYIGRTIPLPIVEKTIKDFKLLDEFIGLEFSLVAISPVINMDPFEGIRKTKLFQYIQPTCVIVQPASSRLYDVGGATVVRLVDDKFIGLSKVHAGKVLLVRPDRYVAGEFSNNQCEEFSHAAISALRLCSANQVAKEIS